MTKPRRESVAAPFPPAPRKPVVALWWQARTSRERTLLTAAAIVVTSFTAWTLAVAPALQTITTANDRLPALRADVALAGAMALEAKALRSEAPMAHDTNASTQEQLSDWLQRSDLSSTIRVVVPSAEGRTPRLLLHIDNAEAAQLIRWLATLPEILPVTVIEAALARTVVDGRDQPGRISGTVDLKTHPEGSSP